MDQSANSATKPQKVNVTRKGARGRKIADSQSLEPTPSTSNDECREPNSRPKRGKVDKNDVVADIENDYQKTLEKCQKITEEDCKKYPWHKKLIGQILRLLAPLM